MCSGKLFIEQKQDIDKYQPPKCQLKKIHQCIDGIEHEYLPNFKGLVNEKLILRLTRRIIAFQLQAEQ